MARPDYRGARGSNAGDDFHVLWALRQTLTLLDQDTNLSAVTVEGLRAEDESGVPQDTWNGVDCTFYFGGDQIATADCIVIDQLKYSAANPDQTWTVARLTHSTNKKQDNSVMGRLAKAFSGLKTLRPDLVDSGNLVVRLVSNQQVDPAVINALSGQKTSNRSDRITLQGASGLYDEDYNVFARSLDFSECGQDSRFALEMRAIETISDWTEDDARVTVDHLMRFIQKAMMPESKGEYITRQSIILWMGFSDRGALFPCPSAIKRIERLIPRKISQTIVKRMLNGDQRICLHGEGGCGKTATLQEIEEMLLPPGSIIVIFDCYGGGRYLDSDAYRHRPKEAFLQLSNDLARQLRIPLLVSSSSTLDYPRIFKKRLEKAAEVVASQDEDALLIVAVDAADNSITAATTQSPPERSFIHDFVALGELSTNVRLVLTTRTGRLPSLNLPRDFTQVEIPGFSQSETAAHVRRYWNDVPHTWIDDFHHLSHGNPRVQRYALVYSVDEPVHALDYLLPNGKDLDEIFREQLEHARHKVGHDQDIRAFCSGLIALPRPIPLADLSAVTGLSKAHLRDLCSDLAPGIRHMNQLIGFADEDFENFLRAEAETRLGPIQLQIAEHLLSRHRSDAYAATHVAMALLAVDRRQEIIDLIKSEQEPTAIGDPVLRREVKLQRLRIAMKVCRESGNSVDALLTLLIGAEALKTDAIIRRTLIENPDLAANFAQDTSSRMILRDPEEIEAHGPLLFHLMAIDSRKGDGILVREGQRHVRAWMQRRAENIEEQRRKEHNFPPQGWTISYHDIAAETEAILRIAGPQSAVDGLRRWRPKSIALIVALILSRKLITSGESSLVEYCIVEETIQTPWDLFLLTPLALAGKVIDLSRIEASLVKLMRRGLIRLDELKDTWGDYNFTADYLDTLLTACEIFVARGGDFVRIAPIIKRFAAREFRRRDKLYTSQVQQIDLSLRAHALLERLVGHKVTLDSYLVDPPVPSEELPPEDLKRLKRADSEKKEELEAFIEPLMEIYDVRAQALIGQIPVGEVETHLLKAISHFHGRKYRIPRQPSASDMRTLTALSITRLMALTDLDRSVPMECAIAVQGSSSDLLSSAGTKIFTSLALDRSLHQQILEAVTSQTKAIKTKKISAEDKISTLVDYARLLLPISFADAESLFNSAIEVAGEVNAEAVHEIALFAPLVDRAVDSIDIVQRKKQAHNLSIIVSDASIRLAGYDHFPWAEASQALATLSVCFALAATARWEDLNIVDQASFLPTILETALSRHELTPVQVVALSTLLDNFSVDLIDRIVNKVIEQEGKVDQKLIAEHLAREELLRFSLGTRQVVSEKLSKLVQKDSSSFWVNQLSCATTFHQSERSTEASSPNSLKKWHNKNGKETKHTDPFDEIDWSAYHFINTEEIEYVISRILAATRASETFVSVEIVLDRIGDNVALSDRVSHLEALSNLNSRQVPDYEQTHAIGRRIDDWHAAPSVDRWCSERLLQVVVNLLPGFSRWLALGQSPLPNILEKSGATDQQICDALLEGIERHVDNLSASTVYTLVGLIGCHCKPSDVAQVIDRYSNRLVHRIPLPERDSWNLNDIPNEIVGGMTRFLYALMGDVDVRVRWRAAHALRNLARLGDICVINEFIELYERISESSYRAPDAPFYWLAARLWLMITLDRIASDIPEVLGGHGLWLFERASDEEFPHILLRSFANSAVFKLVESGNLELNQSQQDTLRSVNTSPMPRKKVRNAYRGHFDRYKYQQLKERRFYFNSMDTLPYWYSGALSVFADVSGEEYLDVAERWIVERWGVDNNPWQWEDEPRKHHLPDGMDHRNGQRPTLERYHTYLEWHAMWCASGELLQTRRLAIEEDDDYFGFENWLNRECLTSPPLWLSDLQSMKPLEEQLWFPPRYDVDVWVENVSDNDFLTELGLADDNETIVVGSNHDTRSRSFRLSARVVTALASPTTAKALVRALQTVSDSWSYRIPAEGDELEIDAPPYKLVGWLLDSEQQLGIDERDPLRYEICAIECKPSSKTARSLGLIFTCSNQTRWVEAKNENTVFVYEAWGDIPGDMREESLIYDKAVRSNGWRLQVDKKALKAFLSEIKLDLIVEVEITRKNKGYEYYPGYDEEETKEARFDRVILLRRDGTIEAAEGSLGTWEVPRP